MLMIKKPILEMQNLVNILQYQPMNQASSHSNSSRPYKRGAHTGSGMPTRSISQHLSDRDLSPKNHLATIILRSAT